MSLVCRCSCMTSVAIRRLAPAARWTTFTTRVASLMHPRRKATAWTRATRRRADDLLAFVRAHGEVHPRAVDAHFSHGSVVNYWGGTSSATTHLLEAMHYAGWLRVARRDAGIRIYAAREPATAPADAAARRAALDALVDVLIRIYAPVPARSLVFLLGRLRYAVPHWHRELTPSIARAKSRLAHAHVDGHEWYWPADESPADASVDDEVRLLAPFDPIAWDRRRFELLWQWEYRFEAYTPVAKRQFGYYALPLLWRDRIIGWANSAVNDGRIDVQLGYVDGRSPRDRPFTVALAAELERLRFFLGVRSEDAATRTT